MDNLTPEERGERFLYQAYKTKVIITCVVILIVLLYWML